MPHIHFFSCPGFLVSKKMPHLHVFLFRIFGKQKKALQVLPALPQVASLVPLPQVASLVPLLQVALLVLLLLLPRPAPLLVPLLPRPAPSGFHTQRHPIAANLLISLYNCHTWWSGSMICDCGPPPCKFNVLWLSTANFQTIQICSHKHHTADCQIWLRHADKTSLILWQKIWISSWIGPPGGVVNSMPRTLYRPQGPWRYHVIGFVEDQEKVPNFKDQENMLLYYLLDVIVEISGYMKYKYMLCICCNCVCMLL